MNEAQGKGATVAIARTRERHRSPERVLDLVRQALDHLGGISRFVQANQTVLIKPNLTVYYSAEEGCTTDPLVVGALIQLAREAGASRVQVAESSGEFLSSIECMRVTGMAAVAEKHGAELIDLGSDEVPNRTVPIPNGQVLRSAPLPAPLLDADVIIDVPKAKNHHIEPITGALKNWVGVVNQKWRMHHHGDEEHIPRFVDIMTVTRPALCVVDALIAGEGDGPIGNLPRWCGCILASSDPVATDVAIARLMGRDWTKLEFARAAEERGLGMREPISFVGEPLEEVAFQAWPGHEGFDYLPINFLVGSNVTLAGTVGHVKSVIDSMLRRGELNQVIWLRGTPTIMVGEVDDPRFEEHLQEGPYIVFDDSAKPQYRNDPRVHFVPGHPVLRNAMPELLKGLGVKLPAELAQRWQKFERQRMHELQYGSRGRQLRVVGRPLLTVGLAAASAFGLRALLRRLSRKARKS